MHRRRWLELGLGAAAVLALGGDAAAWIEPGLRAGRLTAAGRLVWEGAPQSIDSDHFLETQPIDGPIGFKLEARRALRAMAQIQFAAGAREVLPVHELARPYRSWDEARPAIRALPMRPLATRVVSAHVLGGCGLAGREALGVTRPDGVHWPLDNLSVHDGSLFPTSVGANPQLSIYGIANRLAQGLARRLGGSEARLA